MTSLKKSEISNFSNTPEYLQEPECAAVFGVSVFFLRRLRYQGRIPAASINGRMILYPVAEVRAFFERATTIGAKSTCGVWTAKRAPRKARAVKQEGLK
jgi:hypothetical protein